MNCVELPAELVETLKYEPPEPADVEDAEISPQRGREFLAHVPVETFRGEEKLWIPFCMGFIAGTKGDPDARADLKAWSVSDPHYHDQIGKIERRIDSFKPEGGVHWGTAVWLARQNTDDVDELNDLLNSMRADNLFDPVTPDEPATPERPKHRLITSAEFNLADYRQSYIIDGVLVEGQPCIIGGPSKTLKTGIAIDLAISIGTGTCFLSHDRFTVKESRRVALLSGESGAFVIQGAARRVCEARDLELTDADVMWGFDLPQLSNKQDLKLLESMLQELSIRVLIVDPAYLCLLSGGAKTINASNVFEMGPLLRSISKIGERTGCTIILIHHTRKADRRVTAQETTLEDLAMSGFAEWARQWLLLSRTEPYDGQGTHRLTLGVGGSAGHSGKYRLRIDEGRHDEGRRWLVEIVSLAAAIARDEQAQAMQAELEKEIFHEQLLQAIGDGATSRQLRQELGDTHKIRTAIKEATSHFEEIGRIEKCDIVQGNNQTYRGFRVVTSWSPNVPDWLK